MNRTVKTITSYLFLFIESILLFVLTCLIIAKCTIFNTNYVKNKLDKNNYYQELYSEILTEMSYYTNQSGFEDSILDNTFTLGEVKYETNKFIENTYKGKALSIDTTKLKERLKNNIDDFIAKSSFKLVEDKEIDSFINTMSDVYQDEIKLMGYAEKGSRLLTKVTSLGNKLIIVLSVAIILLILINSKIFKRKDFSILLYTSSFILLFTYYYINNNIDIKNIFVYSSLVSKIAKNVINNILNSFIIIAIIYIILGIILGLFKKIKKS